MRFQTGFADGSAIVHLTHTTLVADALCGAGVAFTGTPDLGILCEDCDRLAAAAGGDRSEWLVVSAHVTALPLPRAERLRAA